MIYGSDRIKPDAMPALLAERKITFPVLLDPTRAYRKALDLAIYPSATLLDGNGRVVWQGQPYWRKKFADACEAALEKVIGPVDHAQERKAGN